MGQRPFISLRGFESLSRTGWGKSRVLARTLVLLCCHTGRWGPAAAVPILWGWPRGGPQLSTPLPAFWDLGCRLVV